MSAVMPGSEFDETAFFPAIAHSGALSEAERQETLSLIRWFRRRYPTPAERLAYVRRAYRRWAAARPRPS